MITPLQSRRVPHPDGAWPTPTGYIFGAVDLRIPGYRSYTVDLSPFPVTIPVVLSGELVVGDDLLDGTPFGMTNGQTSFDTAASGGASGLVWDDRLGELLGFARPPGAEESGLGATLYARSCSPLWLPYLGAKLKSSEVRREMHVVSSRLGRPVPCTWGGVVLTTWEITLWHWAAPATTWYRSGSPVAVVPSSGTRHDGVVLDCKLAWRGPHRDIAVLTLVLVEEMSS